MTGELATELVESIAEHRNIEPTELDYALHEYVDIEALEQLARHDSDCWTCTFELPECTVTVTGDREIEVERPDQGIAA